MIEIIVFLIFTEILFFIFVIYIRRKNQWFITAKDKRPVFDKVLSERIFLKSYDKVLGWDRKPNTEGVENTERGIVKWSMNNNGARNNLEYNDIESSIAIFGDSFSFSREVNDNQTWGYKLSKLRNTNIENFGVGNFGFDQALIKLTNKLNDENFKPKSVIIGVVPDTISRILSIWKHYYEYGNIYGFAPRFKMKDSKIELINNYINSEEKFQKIEEYLEQIQANDFFYKNKFQKEIIQFPYSINFMKNFTRNIFLSYETIKMGEVKKPTPYLMKRNLDWRIKLYEDKENVDLLLEEVKLFYKLSKEYGFAPYFLVIPQKDDVLYMNKNRHFYKKVIDNVPSGVNCIDVYEYIKELEEKELNDLYVEKSEYGGHLNEKGNELISNIIDNILRRNNSEKSI